MKLKLSVCLVLLAACGGSSVVGASDGGTTSDAGTSSDAGSSTDAGSGITAGHDAGTAATCGNGVIDPGEQCDDGNVFDLDGCDSNCQYEMLTRVSTLSIETTAAPSFCNRTENAFGTKVLTSIVVSELNPPVQSDIAKGNTNIFVQYFGLTGATSFSGPAVGFLAGSLDPAKGTWPATDPVDWWFLASPANLADGLPTQLLSLTKSGNNLTAGPGDLTVSLSFAGSPALLEMRDASISASIDTSPAADAPAAPPSKLAAGFTAFQSITGSGAGQGLCGNITVDSLAQIPVPQQLTTGTTACSIAYVYCGSGMPVSASCNSLLDVIVSGCSVLGGAIVAVNPTQPDVPASDMGSTVTQLVAGASHKVPTSVTSGDLDAYSSFFTFAATRDHFTGQTCATTTDCQTGQTCTSGACTPP